jgi:hypothetical protein
VNHPEESMGHSEQDESLKSRRYRKYLNSSLGKFCTKSAIKL